MRPKISKTYAMGNQNNGTIIIGVSGPIGSGKTTVCKMLAEKGVLWINTDEIVHELYATGRPGWKKIRGYFGDEYLNKEGVNRKKLRKVLLKHPQKLWIVNQIIHPLVAAEVNKKIVQAKAGAGSGIDDGGKGSGSGFGDGTAKIFCIESAYFDEKNLGKIINLLVRVEATAGNIISRLHERDLSKQEILRFLRMTPHIPRKPDFVIQNDGSMQDLKNIIGNFWDSLAD